jgi:hypothetical protein
MFESVKKLLQNTNETIAIHQEITPANEFGGNHIMLLGAYPWLFFFGEGVASQNTQPTQWLEYILNYGDNRFAHEQTLILSLFNQRQRHEAAQTVAAKIKAHPQKMDKFINYVNDSNFFHDLENAITHPNSKEAKNIMKNILPTLNITGANVTFGPIERNKSLSKLYALCQHFGLPTWFITISPSDIDSSMVMKLSGVINQDLPFIFMPSDQRAQIAAMNPAAGAKFFQRLVDKVFLCLFKSTANGGSDVRKTISYASRKQGILGKMIAHFMVFEVQGRGSLHLHALIWAELSTSLLERIAHVPTLVREVQNVLNSIVLANMSIAGYRESYHRKLLNCTYRGQLQSCPPYGTPDFQKRLDAIITTVNVHKHRPTCRHGKSGKIGCRFCFPQTLVDKRKIF